MPEEEKETNDEGLCSATRGQVDLIDMQSMAHMNYKWIMVYEDHLTKSCVYRPLTSGR